ncbi:hypothetical protein [Pseudoxanthomonas wuyuanensis]|uniref:Uncharacterized protein n=1 Tax=Pseudoxanthomonas wuyuanensis TaxID=1073196 RepID=A0A286D6P4_9GAMM|nr:hypothetical protein [Pseudoxanthomonas wuyuanensis]KAF1718748.1 hypothetical protein CSC75_18165 [Pseudoxanthomonas wuyuanensis]SOD54328.1 hypothetical protein SAMN06296416_103252 [Pseudoxanthomonas wuyuanensis]
MFRTILSMAAILLALAAAGPASAGPLVDVAVVDRDSGQWLPQYPHRRDTWVAGRPGHRYAVRLTNTSGQRVLVVLSVDGVNAITGQTADPGQAGYVLGPWESAEITGWRKSLSDVAQFVFTDLGDSYAARTGRPDNVGVIGVAVFEEARPRHYHYPPSPPPIARGGEDGRRQQNERSATAPAATDAIAEKSLGRQSIGTGHGQREWSPVGQTGFVRATRSPSQITQLRYDAHHRLVALGVIPHRYRHFRFHDRPDAFPGGFVADPPGGYR